ncbi:2-acylglycerol O-acyltransferase 1 [Heterocephalus glaber]|uniref:2-acylglycerol O-acyltransferase 1 n=1 Tax=Heterocephalus glaber TaxID=10181 RepID=A0AAX6RSX5_HETGA|nr:2-acylglycerol O-acyltransferase 1 [Heterocephalus glaber]
MANQVLYILSFLLFAQVYVGIMIILIIYNCWFLYLPYLTWLYFDWRPPEQGDRRSNWIRSWTLWKYFKDYFPIHLIKTHDLDPCHNYIYGAHPHGILVLETGNFCTNYSGFKELFPGLISYLHVISSWFRCPLFQEYLMSFGKYWQATVSRCARVAGAHRKSMWVTCRLIGRPIPDHQTLHPTQEQTEELHQIYMQELRILFEEHKGKYGIVEHGTLIFR